MRNNLVLLLCGLIIFGCKRNLPEAQAPEPTNIFGVSVPAGFKFENTNAVNVNISILNPSDKPVSKVVIKLWSAPPEEGGTLLFKGQTNASGAISIPLTVTKTLKQAVLTSNYLCIPTNILIDLSQPNLSLTFGGSNPKLVSTSHITLNEWPFQGYLKKPGLIFSNRILTGWNADGVPNNKVVPKDVVPDQLVTDVWNALPSQVSVPNTHPDWLSDSLTKRTILITKTADVWVTFVTEGAGFKNTLFYYRYNKNNPPTSLSQVDSFFVIFPNASLVGSGGSLLTGDKVYLGRFGPDTVIAYGIIANGFDAGSSTISGGYWNFFANKELNQENPASLKQHMVMFYDQVGKRFLMCFEDMLRTASGCDHDFNDVIFYTTANPVDAIMSTGIVTLPPSNDQDGDGVNDVDDEYPTDPLRAFNNYFPSATGRGTFAFEDLWPDYGDYDMNDMVVDFRHKVVTNAQNSVKDFEGNYTLRATGGQFESSFAMMFPTTASNLTNITGASLEPGQTAAVLKVINNARTVQPRWNTILGEPYADTVNYTVKYTLNSPVAATTFGINEYNPFIWGNTNGRSRGYEIHLPGKSPSALVKDSLFGKGDDATNVAQGLYYQSKTKLPWAIMIPERFDYPTEKSDIVTAHLKFSNWVQSNGTLNTDWYKNLSGYRNATKIYSKP